MMCGKLDAIRIAELQELAKLFPVSFKNWELLHRALIHTSFANENRQFNIEHNERLEFLGDAVLQLVISSHLFQAYPNYPEGELTKIRAAIVCEPCLARQASRLKLGTFLLLGKGEETSGGRVRVSTLADAFEAVIGAIYLDGGLATATQFVLSELDHELSLISRGEYSKDYKTTLQELVQRNGDSKIVYEVVQETGPDHDKQFTVAVILNGFQQGSGTGKSKKEAEQAAAASAITSLY
jgi:ribonuclease-3